MNVRFHAFGDEGLRVHVLPLTKFKTTSVVLEVLAPLREETVTLNALLPSVLERGTRRSPTVKQLQDRLDDLYGASLDSSMYKLGERQVIQFELEVPNEKFLPGAPPLLDLGIELLAEVIKDPARDDGLLRASFVELEKEALRKRLESIVNNKGRYALIRCIEELCAGEPYRLLSYGRLEDLPGIDARALTEHHARWLRSCPMRVYVVGDVAAEPVARRLLAALSTPDRALELPGPTPELMPERATRELVDRFEVQQGQLILGYRTPVRYTSAQYPAFLVFNGVLGGYAHSKLFMNVREKESLAYSAFSRYESHKGLFLMQAGINLGDFARARALMLEQVDQIARGEVSELELAQTQAMLANDYREMADAPDQLAHHAFVEEVEGMDRPIETMIRAIQQVTVAELQELARQLRLDLIYELKERAEVAHA